MYNFMRSVSRFGDWPSHVAIGLLLLGTAWIRGSRKWSRVFLAMLIAMALAGGAEQVIKRTIPRARPSVHADIRWGGRTSAANIIRFHPGMLALRRHSLAFYCSPADGSVSPALRFQS